MSIPIDEARERSLVVVCGEEFSTTVHVFVTGVVRECIPYPLRSRFEQRALSDVYLDSDGGSRNCLACCRLLSCPVVMEGHLTAVHVYSCD